MKTRVDGANWSIVAQAPRLWLCLLSPFWQLNLVMIDDYFLLDFYYCRSAIFVAYHQTYYFASECTTMIRLLHVIYSTLKLICTITSISRKASLSLRNALYGVNSGIFGCVKITLRKRSGFLYGQHEAQSTLNRSE